MTERVQAQEPTELLWVDCEMTGLDLSKDKVIEFAAIATDANLKPLDDGVNWIIRTDMALLDGMDDWCTKQHGGSGLTAACLKSQWTLAAVDSMALAYARKHIPNGKILLAGSSVHVDKQFLKQDLPRLHNHLHYRVLDVSSIKEVTRRWYPQLDKVWKSQNESSHRALDDIKASIEELRRYREHVFKDPSEVKGTDSKGTGDSGAKGKLEEVATALEDKLKM